MAFGRVLKIGGISAAALVLLLVVAAIATSTSPKQSPSPSPTATATPTPTAEEAGTSIPTTLGNAGTSPTQTEGVLVTKAIDGDTIALETGERVRYTGIDTPETVHPSKPVQCFGKEASAKNKELVAGKRVRLEKDVSETDKYGRLLRYVYIDGTFVNDFLVRQGFAHSTSYPPDVKYQEQFRQAEQEARQNNRGLWAGCPLAGTTASPTSTAQTQSQTGGSCATKGNISSSGEKIYHVPGCGSYDRTVITPNKGERYFCSESEAVAAGWRKAKNCP